MAKPHVPRVTYVEKESGQFVIVVLEPFAPSLRSDFLPKHLVETVQRDFHQTLTLEETRKLRAAQAIGEPIYTAVWDDLVARRVDTLASQANTSAAKWENGRDALTANHYPSYRDVDPDRGR